MNEHVDINEFNVNNIQPMGRKAMAIQCDDEDEMVKLREEISTKLGDKYEIHTPSIKNKQIKIVGMSKETDAEELTQMLKKQNDNISGDTELKVLKVFENRKITSGKYGAIVEVHFESFDKIMATKKLNAGWDRCRVFEYVNVLRCYKCLGFNHIASNCTKDVTCAKCGKQHESKECEATIANCPNCTEANVKWNAEIDTNHSPYDRRCPTLRKQTEKAKNKTPYK